MFVNYKIVYPYTTIADIDFFIEIEIDDSEFKTCIPVKFTKDMGLDIVGSFVSLYESRGLNVAANLAKLFDFLWGRYDNGDPKELFERVCKLNPGFARYKEEVEKYLLLL